MTDIQPASPQHADSNGRPIGFARVAVLIAAVLLAALLVFMLTRNGGTTTVAPTTQPSVTNTTVPSEEPTSPADATPATTTTSGAPVPAPSPSPDATATAAVSGAASATAGATGTAPADPALAECTPVSEGFVPTRYSIDAVGADAKVFSLGLDNEGNIAAPPKNERAAASWWNQGPRPGDDAGKAVFSIHTYRNGGAVGNDLYEGGRSQLSSGDIIKVYGADGQVLCYEMTEAKKIWIDEYDPDSDIMVDYEGRPQMLIIICWDFDRQTEIWDSRVFFYASPITV